MKLSPTRVAVELSQTFLEGTQPLWARREGGNDPTSCAVVAEAFGGGRYSLVTGDYTLLSFYVAIDCQWLPQLLCLLCLGLT